MVAVTAQKVAEEFAWPLFKGHVIAALPPAPPQMNAIKKDLPR